MAYSNNNSTSNGIPINRSIDRSNEENFMYGKFHSYLG